MGPQTSHHIEIDNTISHQKNQSENQKSRFNVTAIIAAFCVSILLLFLWMFFTLKYRSTCIPVVISLFIATLIKKTGKSQNPLFGVYSAFLSLCIAIIGNLFEIIVSYSKHSSKPIAEILVQLDAPLIIAFLNSYTRPIDLLMYAGVIYGGFWFAYSHKPVTSSNI